MQSLATKHDGSIDVYNWQEGVGIIAKAANENGYFVKGKRGKKPKKYYNSFLSFDIETTKLKNDNWEPGQPKMFRYFNYTYLWGVYIDDYFISGRDISEFFSMLAAVQQFIAGGYMLCFVHNLAFEYGNNADYFLHTGFEDAFFRNASTPLYIQLAGFEFRCTAQLTHKSLKQIGKEIGIEKLGDEFDYNRILSPLSELDPNDYDYQYRDVKIVWYYIKKETGTYTKRIKKPENACFLPLTQTGYVRNDIKDHFSYTGSGYLTLRNTALTKAEYHFLRPCFYGGYVHTNPRIIGEEMLRVLGEALLHLDLKSAYPWAFVTKRFVLKYTEVLEKVSEYTLRKWLSWDHMGLVADVTLYGVMLKPRHVPYIPYDAHDIKSVALEAVHENGKIVSADAVTITLCDTDLRLILDVYDIDKIEVNRCYTGKKKNLPYAIVERVISFFCGKSELKDVITGDPELDAWTEYCYALSKQLLNGIYGLAAQSLENFEYKINPRTLMVDKSPEPDYKEAKVLPYQIAFQITAYVREAIVSMCNFLCSTPGQKFWYSDTDSIFCRDTPEARDYVKRWNAERIAELENLEKLYFDIIPVTPKGVKQYLGTFEIEPDTKDSVSFCSIGSKRYYIGYKDGTYSITFSGLRGTKRVYDKKKEKWENGYNTQRLIDMCGGMHEAFLKIKEDKVILPFVDGIDKLSHFNVRGDFMNNTAFGYEVRRPCSYTLVGQDLTLSLNPTLDDFLKSIDFVNLMEAEDDI